MSPSNAGCRWQHLYSCPEGGHNQLGLNCLGHLQIIAQHTAKLQWFDRDCTSAACCLQDVLFTSLDCSLFTQALAMCGLSAFTSRRLQRTHLQSPEQQLADFLTFMGLPPLPGQQQLAVPNAAPAATSTTASQATGASGKRPHGMGELKQPEL